MLNKQKLIGAFTLLMAIGNAQASVILYDQNFEAPNLPFNDDLTFLDASLGTSVNEYYGGQPSGFNFAQTFTVETININGGTAFNTGYIDSTGTGGNYALGMFSDIQDDLLALTFDTGGLSFFNVSMDLSSIGLQANAAAQTAAYGSVLFPDVFPNGTIPTFEFSLYSEGGTGNLGGGTLLGQETRTVNSSANNVFDWSNVVMAFDTTGDVDGIVTLRIDMTSGVYGAMDNMLITASDTEGDFGGTAVSSPVTISLLMFGMFGILATKRLRKTA